MEVTVGSDRFTEQHHFSTQTGLKVNFRHLWQLFPLRENFYQPDRDGAQPRDAAEGWKKRHDPLIPDSLSLLLQSPNLDQSKKLRVATTAAVSGRNQSQGQVNSVL